jgi:hypothetical protein
MASKQESGKASITKTTSWWRKRLPRSMLQLTLNQDDKINQAYYIKNQGTNITYYIYSWLYCTYIPKLRVGVLIKCGVKSNTFHFTLQTMGMCGPGSSVGSDWLRAGRFGDWIPVGAKFSAPVQTSPGAHPASCTMGTRSFPGVKYGQGVLLTTHPLLVPWSWKSTAIPPPTLWATPGL